MDNHGVKEGKTRTIKLTYFKDSGKYYAEGVYESKQMRIDQVFDEVRLRQVHPGLNGPWSGYIFVDVQSDDGYPALIMKA